MVQKKENCPKIDIQLQSNKFSLEYECPWGAIHLYVQFCLSESRGLQQRWFVQINAIFTKLPQISLHNISKLTNINHKRRQNVQFQEEKKQILGKYFLNISITKSPSILLAPRLHFIHVRILWGWAFKKPFHEKITSN